MSTEVQPLHSAWEVLPAEDPEGQLAFLNLASTELKRIERANVQIRVLMGRQLLLIQSTQTWRKFPGVDDCKDWSAFVDVGFERLTGLSRETAYGALQLARCKAIAAVPIPDLGKFTSLANAILLARIERQNGGVTREVIEAAMTEPAVRFRELVGHGKPLMLEVLVQDPLVLPALRKIVNWLKLADPDALEAFWTTLERARLHAGDNPSDTLMCVDACCYHTWGQEVDE